MDQYARRPKVSRFQEKKTFGARTVKRTSVVKRTVNNLRKGRTLRTMRPMRKGR